MKIVTTVICTLLCLCTLQIISAQETSTCSEEKVYEAVYLESGSKIIGRILEWDPDPDGLFKFEFQDGRQITLFTKSVRRVRSLTSIKIEKPYRFKEQGLYQRMTLGVSSGPVAGQTLTHSVGYRWNKMLGVGIGAGYANYRNGEGQRLIPVFAEIQGFLLEKNISPYYSFRAGYAWASGREDYGWSDQSRGGILVNPEIGYRMSAGEDVNFMIGIGVKLQKANFVKADPVKIWYDEDYTVKRYELSLAMIF